MINEVLKNIPLLKLLISIVKENKWGFISHVCIPIIALSFGVYNVPYLCPDMDLSGVMTASTLSYIHNTKQQDSAIPTGDRKSVV